MMKNNYSYFIGGAILLLMAVFTAPSASAAAKSELVYIGAYTGAKSKGIYVARFDPETGRLTTPELAAETKNPSFLAVHPNQQFLYAVGEIDRFKGKPSGAVSAFRIDGKTGKLTLLNQQSSGGSGPCHLDVDQKGRCVLVANYGSGSIAAFPLQSNGALGEATAVIQHSGSSLNKDRQAGPHAHFITLDPANHLALACDLGLDKILLYDFDSAAASLKPHDPSFATVKAGVGPRHLVFHPKGKWIYVINEMGSSITTFDYDGRRGSLSEKQTVSTLPGNFAGANTTAEIQIHPSGKFVYGSNRGHNSIATFSVDSKTGELTLVNHCSTQGKTPRHFILDPSGKWLLAENQDSDSIVIFGVDQKTGGLAPGGQAVEVGSPVCLQFLR